MWLAEYDDMTGEEMQRYFSNEFVLIPGQGTFCPGKFLYE